MGSGEDVENKEKFFEMFNYVEEMNGKSHHINGSNSSSLIVIIVISFTGTILSLTCWISWI